MKNSLLKSALLLVSVLFFSCQVEPLDPALASTINNGSNGSSNVSDYWPAAVDNTWNYNQNSVAQSPSKILSTEVINGATYYNFSNVLGQSSSAAANVSLQLRKNNGDYFIRMPSFTVNYGGGLSAQSTTAEFLMFKDYLDVNQTWTSNYSQTFTYNMPAIPATTTNVVLQGTMLEKNVSLTVSGVSYSNVIKFKVVQTATIQGQATSTTTTSNYWFAKNVGCIKAISQSTGTADTTTELTSYVLH